MTIADATGPPAGFWPSPWSPAQVAAGKVARGGLQVDGHLVAWVESRPDEGGRQVVVGVDAGSSPTAAPVELSPAGTSVRSRVHEYGGGAATLAGGVLYYVDDRDQSWWRVEPGAAPPLRLAGTEGAPPRHADGRPVGGGRWLVSVEERVAGTSASHRLVVTPTDGRGPAVALVDGGDFVSSPRPSPDGRWLAWTGWDHPDMPWDSTTLWVAPLSVTDAAVTLGPSRVVAGGPGVSVGQVLWTADGSLVFVDDRTGWWMPYRVAPGALDDPGPVPAACLVDTAAEFHVPDWVFGRQTICELDDGALLARMGAGGRDHLVVLRPPAGGPGEAPWSCAVVDQPCLSIAGVARCDDRTAAVLGTTATESNVVLAVPLDGSGAVRRLSAPPRIEVDITRASVGERRTVTAADHRVPGHFFPPCNPDVSPVPGSLPPLVVFCHGGPTAAAEAGYDPVVQFFTSRGVAVAAVDYRGSTGYGRAYRDLLSGAWGEGDVDDCITFARSLADEGVVDGARMAIRGTSAGGLTALSALVRSRVFAGAVAWYGVTDLAALATDTHDFESRYMDGLVGPLPEAADRYRDRSPLHHAADLEGRVLLLQGSEDPIVPLDQAERFAAELRAGGKECRLVVFEGESHGFRRAETIEAALEAELAFYRDLFGPAGDARG